MSRTPQVGDPVTVTGVVTRVLEIEPGVTIVSVVFGYNHARHPISFEAEDVTVLDQPVEELDAAAARIRSAIAAHEAARRLTRDLDVRPVVVTDSDGRRREVPRG